MLSILSKNSALMESVSGMSVRTDQSCCDIDTDGMVRGLLIYWPLKFHIVFYASNRPTNNKRQNYQGSKIPIALMQPSDRIRT